MPSTDQASSDYVVLVTIGKFLIAESIEITTFILIYGIFILLFAQSTAIFFQKRLSSRAHLWMFLTSAFSFLSATLQGATLLADMCIVAHLMLVGNQDLTLQERLQLTINLRWTPTILLLWASAFGPIISDSIVVWRAFVLLQHRRWLTILPLLLLLGSIVMTAGNAILGTMGSNIRQGLTEIFYQAGLCLSLTTNVVATALIGYVYWLHKRVTAVLSPGRYQSTQGVRVLATLVESGVVFCIPQAIFIIFTLAPQNAAAVNIQYVFTTAYFAFAWMYPTMVIVLVNRHYTLDQYLSNPSLAPIHHISGTNHVGPIVFAPPGPATTNEE